MDMNINTDWQIVTEAMFVQAVFGEGTRYYIGMISKFYITMP